MSCKLDFENLKDIIQTLSSLDPSPRGRWNFKNSWEKPSDKCQRSQIKQQQKSHLGG